MTELEILTKARELIADPERWATGELARDAGGHKVPPDSPSACRWCAYGALQNFADDRDAGPLLDAAEGRLADAACDVLNATPEFDEDADCLIAHVNDDLGHAATLQMFDRAIEMAGGGE